MVNLENSETSGSMRPDQIEALETIISAKSWEQHDFLCHPEKEVRQALYQLMSKLTGREIDLVISLLRQYVIIREYGHPVRSIIKQLDDVFATKEILLCPVLEVRPKNTKSGSVLHYDISRGSRLFKKATARFLERPPAPPDPCPDVVLVDDFIGSGTQVNAYISHLTTNCGVNVVAIASVVIHENGRNYLEGLGYTVVSELTCSKAIEPASQALALAREQAYAIYDAIEKRIKCHPDVRRGYGQCEATVTLRRTPNNTLPIFWHEGRRKWPAPFPRN